MALFESYERRIPQIEKVLASYGISSLEEAEKITKDAGLDVYHMVEKIQPICFENAKWAYTVGAAIAIKKNARRAADAAAEDAAKTVVLKNAGGTKMQVIKLLKDITGLGLVEAKGLADNGGNVKENIPAKEAEEIKAQLEAAGAEVELV